MDRTVAVLRLDMAFKLVLPIATYWIDSIEGTTVFGEYGVGSQGFHYKLIRWPKHDELILFHGDAVGISPEDDPAPDKKYYGCRYDVMSAEPFSEEYFKTEQEAWDYSDESTRRFMINRATNEVKDV